MQRFTIIINLSLFLLLFTIDVKSQNEEKFQRNQNISLSGNFDWNVSNKINAYRLEGIYKFAVLKKTEIGIKLGYSRHNLANDYYFRFGTQSYEYCNFENNLRAGLVIRRNMYNQPCTPFYGIEIEANYLVYSEINDNDIKKFNPIYGNSTFLTLGYSYRFETTKLGIDAAYLYGIQYLNNHIYKYYRQNSVFTNQIFEGYMYGYIRIGINYYL